MPPTRTQVSCPQCKQPVQIQVEQIFDVTSDPGAKQRMLGGVSNVIHCPVCNYAGNFPTPILYHDADKELLLVFFPPEISLPINEQEKVIGPFIKQIVDRLPAEKRKAYLLQPKKFLTYQSFLEHILGADGITPEMIQAQKQKISAIERIISASSSEMRSEIIKQAPSLFDAEFFAIFSRLMESATANGQDQIAKQMDLIQQQLLTETDYGRKIAAQVSELQEATKTLQAAGKNLDREKLLDIIIDAPSEERIRALVNLTRPGLDYVFFQSLSARIETKSGGERTKLEKIRQILLELTQELDKRVEKEYQRAGELLLTILDSSDIQQATIEHLNEITDAFVQVLNGAIREAMEKKEKEKIDKLQQIIVVLEKASAPPPEVEFIEKLLSTKDEKELEELLLQNKEKVTPEFISMLGNVYSRYENQNGDIENLSEQDVEMIQKLDLVNKAVLRFSMKQNLH